MKHYGQDFYGDRKELTGVAANTILPMVIAEVGHIASVLDAGCGTGTWLSTSLLLGAKRVVGIEGEWVSRPMLDDERIELVSASLEEPITVTEKFDLVVSLEVAEHISPHRAASFVAELCGLSDTVLFGAAIPNQGGKGHVNEQWQSFWANIFYENGYEALDCIRPAIWNDDSIPPWYRQNTILYRRMSNPRAPVLLDAVHPFYWERANRQIERPMTLPEHVKAAAGIPQAIVRAVRKRLPG